MTIIGLERMRDGSSNILVFDPMFGDRSSITKLIGQQVKEKSNEDLLKGYRRGHKYLQKYKEFELLRLIGSSPPKSHTCLLYVD